MIKLSKKEIQSLTSHKYVEKVTDSRVTFTPQFKIKSVKSYFKGKSSRIIFNEAGFTSDYFSNKFVSSCLYPWRKSFNENGEKGLTQDNRGRKAIHSTDYINMNIEDLLERVEYLEQENDFLKKLKALAKK